MTVERVFTTVLVLLGLGFLFFVLPQQVETVEYGRIVPSTVPSIALWIIVIAGIVQLFNSTECIDLHLRNSLRVSAFMAMFIAAVWLMEKFGFEYFAPIFALSIMLFMGERRWYWLLFAALAMPLSIWLLVENVLNRVLP
ncbi:tripartite tricarboxylate transporter TctB family protein [uncultured Sulfitobacter sp.]|uniref:tripartite tricarboxylate transporter TctB family protein n=1 Tax=uncultured Sulfitobacter sp. TaxID=191468 RepID=UPI0026392077|nr:tripartite tricarboxylate transporter TctB family protein [uncultured Sulfitobacter sp.]